MAMTLRHSIWAFHRIALPRKSTPTIKQRVISYHTTKIIAHRKIKIGCHGNVP